MHGTTAKQKILLVAFGIFATVMLLEGVLRLGGFIFTARLRTANIVTRAGDEFRILCIGESTTALGGRNAYPHQLQEILSAKRPGTRFIAINEGQISKNSADISAGLPGHLDTYQPNLVIVMMGVNDVLHLVEPDTLFLRFHVFMRRFRVYKLFELVGAHVFHRLAGGRSTGEDDSLGDDASSDHLALMDIEHTQQQAAMLKNIHDRLREAIAYTTDPAAHAQMQQDIEQARVRMGMLLMAIGVEYRNRGEYRSAEAHFKAAVDEGFDNAGIYVEWGRVYTAQEDYAGAAPFFLRAVLLSGAQAPLALLELARCYTQLNKDDEALQLYRLILERQPDNVWMYPELGAWFHERGYYDEAEQAYKKALEKNPDDHAVYMRLADLYAAQGNYERMNAFRSKAHEGMREAERLLPFTIRNYHDIVDMVQARGIAVIAMQYPLRSIAPLRDILRARPGVIFVENKKNFEAALQRSEYETIFSDNFAGDFGHCTRRGNRLIAENAAAAILSEILATGD